MATASYFVQNANALSFDTQFFKGLDRRTLIKLILCSTVSQLPNIYWIFKLHLHFLTQLSEAEIIILVFYFSTSKILYKKKKSINSTHCKAVTLSEEHAKHILKQLMHSYINTILWVHFLFVTVKIGHHV